MLRISTLIVALLSAALLVAGAGAVNAQDVRNKEEDKSKKESKAEEDDDKGKDHKSGDDKDDKSGDEKDDKSKEEKEPREPHPAEEVVEKYLQHVGAREWSEAVEFLDIVFLRQMKEDYVRRVRRTLSLDQEVALLKAVGVERLRDLEAMDEDKFYVARQQANEEEKLTEATRKRTAETSKIEVVGSVVEEEELVHVMARHTQETLTDQLEDLLVVSVEKHGDRWVVCPMHQRVKVTPLLKGKPTGP